MTLRSHRIDVLDHGYVELVEYMGQDNLPAIEARRTRGIKSTPSEKTVINLTKSLQIKRHSLPTEMIDTRWRMKMPIFVARQLVRHRTASILEQSLRVKRTGNYFEFHLPSSEEMRFTKHGNQAGFNLDPEGSATQIKIAVHEALARWKYLTDMGVAPEQARMILPLNVYTEWTWKCDLHNTLNLLRQRLAPDAQYETQLYAQAMHTILEETFPIIMKAWKDALNASN